MRKFLVFTKSHLPLFCHPSNSSQESIINPFGCDIRVHWVVFRVCAYFELIKLQKRN